MDIDVDKLADKVADKAARILMASRRERAPWERRITIVIGIIAIVSAVFSLGINWSRLSNNEVKINDEIEYRRQLETRIKVVETSAMEQKGDTRLILEKMDILQRDIAEVKGNVGRNK